MHERGVDELLPTSRAGVSADHLEQYYDYPSELTRAWVRMNFVSSLDGAVSVDRSSRGLSAPLDQRVLALIRDLSDVVLVGAGTALAEGYKGIRRTEVRTHLRRRHGLSEVPPIAVVTARCSIPPDSPLVTEAVAPTIIMTCETAPHDRREALSAAGADVVVAGHHRIDPLLVLHALETRGLYRVGCEGGPTLFGALVEGDLVDELCLTMSPLLVSGNASRIIRGAGIEPPTRMNLASALHSESLLLLRYLRMTG